MSLPHFVLSSSQQRLLGEVMLHPLPDPMGGEAAEQGLLVRGLDPEEVWADVSELVFLRLVVRDGGALAATDLGAAVHYRAACEAAEERLAAVVRLAESAESVDPRLARAVVRLAHDRLTLDEAIEELGRTD